MKTRVVALVGALVTSGLLVGATPVSAQKSDYPAPRYPKIRAVHAPEDLLDIARVVVKSPSRRETLRPGYGVKKGERILMVIPNGFSPLVRDALALAIREAGGELDILMLQSEGVNPEELKGKGIEHAAQGPQNGVIEATNMLEPPSGARAESSYRKIVALAEGGKYDMVIEGSGGPQPVSRFRWERVPWDTVEKFVISAAFPGEVQDAIDKKIWDAFGHAKRVHISDAEGTDVTWSIQPEYMQRLMDAYQDPIYPPGTYDVVKRGHVSLTPLFMAMKEGDAKGVVAGTINHAGVFPRVELYLEKGYIVRVEAGGRYGETIQASLKKWANVQYPGFPGPGTGWFIEAALGTNPQRARVTTQIEGEGMSWERGRSGVIHWGFGVATPVTAKNTPAVRKLVAEEHVPGGHLHVHTYFNTIDIETTDGRTVHVADKGHITFLDDPDIRKIASKFGNPDVLLKEAWVPGVPGINMPGEYSDYANNPGPYVVKDVERLKAAQAK